MESSEGLPFPYIVNKRENLLGRLRPRELRSFGTSIVDRVRVADKYSGMEWVDTREKREEGAFIALAPQGRYKKGQVVEIIEERLLKLGEILSIEGISNVPFARSSPRFKYYIRPWDAQNEGKDLQGKGDKAWYLSDEELATSRETGAQ